jgi:hypothetical protein
MAMELGDSTFRPLLIADMMDTWELLKVHSSPPELPGDGDSLPRGFIQLLNVDEGVKRGFTRRVLMHTYRLVGQLRYEEGVVLQDERIDRANELLAVLTAGGTKYTRNGEDWRYGGVAIPFEDAAALDDPTEQIYHVIVDFMLEWVTGV